MTIFDWSLVWASALVAACIWGAVAKEQRSIIKRGPRKDINHLTRDELIAKRQSLEDDLLKDRLSMGQLLNYESYARMLDRMIDAS